MLKIKSCDLDQYCKTSYRSVLKLLGVKAMQLPSSGISTMVPVLPGTLHSLLTNPEDASSSSPKHEDWALFLFSLMLVLPTIASIGEHKHDTLRIRSALHIITTVLDRVERGAPTA